MWVVLDQSRTTENYCQLVNKVWESQQTRRISDHQEFPVGKSLIVIQPLLQEVRGINKLIAVKDTLLIGDCWPRLPVAVNSELNTLGVMNGRVWTSRYLQCCII